MEGRIVYAKKNMRIYRIRPNTFIVHNGNKDFKDGHTHINNYNTAKYVLNLAYYSSIPQKKISNYLLESVIRLSTDKCYIKRIKQLMR